MNCKTIVVAMGLVAAVAMASADEAGGLREAQAWAAQAGERDGVREAVEIYPDAVPERGNPLALWRVFDKAERGGTIRVAVMGGSITEGASAGGREHQWGTLFAGGWRELFPKAKIEFRNAGVGATGSLIAACRYTQDVASFKPDVLALEFSVNDPHNDDARRTMEGLIRRAFHEKTAVILLGMTTKNGTSAQTQHLAAARACGAPYVSYRDGVMRRIKAGAWKWEDVGADGIHPNRHGHAIAGALMTLFVRDELRRYREVRTAWPSLSQSQERFPFDHGIFTPFAKVALRENRGFVPYREARTSWGTGLVSTNAGDRVAFSFTGSAGAFLYRQGNLTSGSGRVKVTVDGVEQPEHPFGYVKDRAWWYTPIHWLCRDKAGTHTVKIETLPAEKPGDPVGFRLAVLMVEP